MNEYYFVIQRFGNWSIVKASVINQTKSNWKVSTHNQKIVFGPYAFIISEVPKSKYPAFINLSDAVDWILQCTLNDLANYARIVATANQEYKKLNIELNKFMEVQDAKI